ncbi:MAG: GGDEF domain-containing protein [Solirubrobacteraceae bacterium]|nr:GGDEF domain-containing protein [Solirubrobacteraceae bacterium]
MESQPADELLRDELTGLPSRVLLRDRLRVALVRRRRPRDDSLAVLSVDIDGMRVFNRQHGRETGDGLLQAAAVRLAELVRAGDTVARAGGDEFVMVCEELTGEDESLVVAERVLEGFDRPLRVGEVDHAISVSVGLVIVAGGEMDPDRVLTEAHRAMLRARGDGPSRFNP